MKPLLILSLILACAADAKPARFDIRDGLQRNVVHFVSDAPLERVVGISTAVWGWAETDPAVPGRGLKAEFEIDMRTFETGLPARNQEIRDKVFLAKENPVAKFTVKRVVKPLKRPLVNAQPASWEVEGELSFRGHTVTERMTLKATYFNESEKTRQRLPGNLLRLQGTLTMDLGRYQIAVPEAWVLRFSEKVTVHWDLFGSDQSPAVGPPSLPPEGPKPKERTAPPEGTAS